MKEYSRGVDGFVLLGHRIVMRLPLGSTSAPDAKRSGPKG